MPGPAGRDSRCRPRPGGWERWCVAVDDVKAVDERDVQARLFHGDVLQAVDLGHVGDAQDRADAGANVAVQPLHAGGLGHLGDLLRQGHLGQDLVGALDGGLIVFIVAQVFGGHGRGAPFWLIGIRCRTSHSGGGRLGGSGGRGRRGGGRALRGAVAGEPADDTRRLVWQAANKLPPKRAARQLEKTATGQVNATHISSSFSTLQDRQMVGWLRVTRGWMARGGGTRLLYARWRPKGNRARPHGLRDPDNSGRGRPCRSRRIFWQDCQAPGRCDWPGNQGERQAARPWPDPATGALCSAV